MMRTGKMGAAAAALALLSGCISLGSEPPAQLLTLIAAERAPVGEAREGGPDTALAVEIPAVPQRLDVARIPVITGDTSLAYLQDAFWVQKPAQLFQTVLAETIRARSGRLVITGGDLEYAATTHLIGTLEAMDYDATTSTALVRFDAVLTLPDGRLLSRRFAHEVPGVLPEAVQVSRALNVASNAVAGEVAEWLGEVPGGAE